MNLEFFSEDRMEHLFGEALPEIRAASENSNPVRELTRVLLRHPGRKGVILAHLAPYVARQAKSRRLGLRVLQKALNHMPDHYEGYVYARVARLSVLVMTMDQPNE